MGGAIGPRAELLVRFLLKPIVQYNLSKVPSPTLSEGPGFICIYLKHWWILDHRTSPLLLTLAGIWYYDYAVRDWLITVYTHGSESFPTDSFSKLGSDFSEKIPFILTQNLGLNPSKSTAIFSPSWKPPRGCRGCQSLTGLRQERAPDLSFPKFSLPSSLDYSTHHGFQIGWRLIKL